MSRTLAMTGVALIALSLLLGLAAARGWLAGIDGPLMRSGAMVQGQTPAFAIRVAQATTHLGDPSIRTLYIVAAAVALIAWQSWRSAGIYVAAVALTITGYSLAKQLFDRPRPRLTEWLAGPVNPSYPSGHAGGAMVVLLLAAMLIGGRGWIAAAICVALAIGASRVAMGVHWPSDVVGGWLFGAGGAMIGYAVALRTAA